MSVVIWRKYWFSLVSVSEFNAIDKEISINKKGNFRELFFSEIYLKHLKDIRQIYWSRCYENHELHLVISPTACQSTIPENVWTTAIEYYIIIYTRISLWQIRCLHSAHICFVSSSSDSLNREVYRTTLHSS
jgi:hypothetical protein